MNHIADYADCPETYHPLVQADIDAVQDSYSRSVR